ncbi:MAG: hypothetical protein B7C24_05035 [Bacteroidetes bacterium 4572_77]|nr:MAG: hypothetical protein B7C24_05035 [Bacteroidetes bacterium 4572_77]
MMNLVGTHRDPLFTNLVNQMWSNTAETPKARPATNVMENEKEFKLQLLVPGWNKEDVKIELDKNILSISGQREEKEEDFIRKEFKMNSFERSFQLPKDIDFEKVSAKTENGILEISIPKDLEKKAKMQRLIDIK